MGLIARVSQLMTCDQRRLPKTAPFSPGLPRGRRRCGKIVYGGFVGLVLGLSMTSVSSLIIGDIVERRSLIRICGFSLLFFVELGLLAWIGRRIGRKFRMLTTDIAESTPSLNSAELVQ